MLPVGKSSGIFKSVCTGGSGKMCFLNLGMEKDWRLWSAYSGEKSGVPALLVP